MVVLQSANIRRPDLGDFRSLFQQCISNAREHSVGWGVEEEVEVGSGV